MFSSDYPHWDMDAPYETTPAFLSREDKLAILGGNACALHGIELTPAEPEPS
jgi:predicted TIM-barrel fold metal-dependent hydrolase